MLIELLWPEREPEASRHSLSMALSSLRPHLEPAGIVPDGSVLRADRHSVALNPSTVTTDVAEFEFLLAEHDRFPASDFVLQTSDRRPPAGCGLPIADCLSRALGLYQGELLPGFNEEWILPEQQRLDELHYQALQRLSANLEDSGNVSGALQVALRGVGANRLREEAHREVIRLYSASGQEDAALRQGRELERMRKEELGVVSRSETRATVHAPAAKALGDSRDGPSVAVSMVEGLSCASIPRRRMEPLDPVGGAVPLVSPFYVLRPTDAEFGAAIARRDSTILVKGPRQVGKTSLLARGLQQARGAGCRVALSHLQILNAEHLQSADALLLALAEMLADQLELDTSPRQFWDPHRGPSPNFRRYLRREVLAKSAAPLVWGLDEVDRLFTCDFGSEVFGLFRSWHDERALDPDGPWGALTLAMAYSTEAHLFITDLNQSPFNVGTRLALHDFVLEQVEDLNLRYGSPIPGRADLTRFYGLVGGQPYLVCAGLREMAAHGVTVSEVETRALRDDWIFGEHLRRIAALLERDKDMAEAARAVLHGRPCLTRESFHRLRSAGVLAGESAAEARFRCPLYATYLTQCLTP